MAIYPAASRDSYSLAARDAVGHPFRHGDRQRDSRAGGDSDAGGDNACDGHTQRNADGDARRDADTNANGHAIANLSTYRHAGRDRQPNACAHGSADGDGHVYATKGNNTVGFWKYTVADSSWTQLENVPLGLGTKVKNGAGLAWVPIGADKYVYLLKGYKNEFYRYNVATGKWETRASAPIGISLKYDKGSFIVYNDTNTIYAHKSKYNELWKYDIAKDSWVKQLTRKSPWSTPARSWRWTVPSSKKRSGRSR